VTAYTLVPELWDSCNVLRDKGGPMSRRVGWRLPSIAGTGSNEVLPQALQRNRNRSIGTGTRLPCIGVSTNDWVCVPCRSRTGWPHGGSALGRSVPATLTR